MTAANKKASLWGYFHGDAAERYLILLHPLFWARIGFCYIVSANPKSMKENKNYLLLEYNTYPIGLYDEGDEIIDRLKGSFERFFGIGVPPLRQTIEQIDPCGETPTTATCAGVIKTRLARELGMNDPRERSHALTGWRSTP